MAASQAILPIFPQLCSCFTNKTNPSIKTERKQYYGNLRGLRSNFPFLKWFLFWHFQKHMAPCSASGFLGCAVPLPCFPELTVPHTHAHTNVQWCPASHSSLSAARRWDLCIPSSGSLWSSVLAASGTGAYWETPLCTPICFKGGRLGLAAPVSWFWRHWVQDRAQVAPKNCSCGALGSCAACAGLWDATSAAACRLEIGWDFTENLPFPSSLICSMSHRAE